MPGVSRFEDLDAYKLAVEIRREVLRLSSGKAVAHDFKFVSQIRDAARGGLRNIAEGFSRTAPAEFSRFLGYARATLDETKSHVIDGYECGYFTDTDRDGLLTLIRRTIGAINRLKAYLESPAARRAYERLRAARSARKRTREP